MSAKMYNERIKCINKVGTYSIIINMNEYVAAVQKSIMPSADPFLDKIFYWLPFIRVYLLRITLVIPIS